MFEKVKIKKIIAREILFGFSIILFCLLCWVGCLGFNLIQEWRVERNREEVRMIIDSDLKRSLMLKLTKRRDFILMVDPGAIDRFELIWTKLESRSDKDSIQYYWDTRWSDLTLGKIREFGIYNAVELDDFIKNTKITDAEVNQNLIMNQKVEVLNSQKAKILSIGILTKGEISDFLLYATSIYSFIVFGIRYSIYILRWSIKTIRL